MKLSPRDAAAYFRRPDPQRAGLLIYGSDGMRVALRRQEVIAALIGPEGEAEMRLARMAGADLRREPAALIDAMKAQGFFPGPRVVLVEDATDGLQPQVEAALADWREGDAQIVATAGTLTARSGLRKLFEGHPNALCAAIYDDPPGRDEIETILRDAGLPGPEPDAMAALAALAHALGPGDFRQTVEKIALYKHGDTSPLTPDEIDACAPASFESAVDDLVHIVAEGRPGEIAPVLRRLQGQGVTPVSLCIGATRHFRVLHSASCDPGGPSAGIARARPPIWGARRDRMQRQARAWGRQRLEQALAMLIDTDLQLRSASQAPAMPMMERTLVRIARLVR